jgi:hypothetical protein
MKTYTIAEGDTLVVSVNNCAWETIAFAAADFQDSAAATAEELAALIKRSGILDAAVDQQGNLVLATPTGGGHTSLEVDLERSTVAARLGLSVAQAHGSGLQSARLTSLAAEPYALPRGAEMSISVDGTKRRITFDSGFTEGAASAAEIARLINARHKHIACVTRDGRVQLGALNPGPQSRLEVEAGRADKVDAAAILGFVGAAALSQPYTQLPAAIVCAGRQPALSVVNLTDNAIELLLPTGPVVLPARGSLHLPPSALAHGPLQRMLSLGSIRLAAANGE